MTAYSQLSDAELVRKVQELMGYSVDDASEHRGFLRYVLLHNEQVVWNSYTQEDCWSHAPNPLTDANVYMGLVDEMENMGVYTRIDGKLPGNYSVTGIDNNFVTITAQSPVRARAICEVYCMVKGSVPSGAER